MYGYYGCSDLKDYYWEICRVPAPISAAFLKIRFVLVFTTAFFRRISSHVFMVFFLCNFTKYEFDSPALTIIPCRENKVDILVHANFISV